VEAWDSHREVTESVPQGTDVGQRNGEGGSGCSRSEKEDQRMECRLEVRAAIRAECLPLKKNAGILKSTKKESYRK